jgi:hypothetical protein
MKHDSVIFVVTLLNYLWKWLIVALIFSLAYEVTCIEKISGLVETYNFLNIIVWGSIDDAYI